MPQFKVGNKVRILVNIDNTWQTENMVAVVCYINYDQIKVQCLDGAFEPIHEHGPRERRLWVAPCYLKLVNWMPISPIFLQEVTP